MHEKISRHFFKTQQKVRQLTVSFMAIVVVVIFVMLCGYFYYTTIKNFNEENEKIIKNYTELQKNLVKTRVEQAYGFIESIRASSDERLRQTLQARVYEAYNAAAYIYEKYKDKEPESSVKQRIKDALEQMRYEDGKSYVWITDYTDKAVTYPMDKSKEGLYIGYIKDQKGNYPIKNQTKLAKTQKEGFVKDFFSKHGEDQNKSFEQITFVKDFGKFGWYFGSAVFLDDFTRKVQNEALEAVAKLRFDNNYIFIDTFDGYALLMNGKKLDTPKYIQELTDKNGVKIVQEQLKAAKSSPDGGYVQYVWHEALLGKDMPHLSFCKAMNDWGWKIGSGLYTGKINDEIGRRKELFRQKMLEDALIMLSILILFVAVSIIVAYAIDKKMLKLFRGMNERIDFYNSELIELNRTLEQRVEEESAKRIEQETLFIQQSKMAMVGEMVDAIAHQWKQPLSAMSILVDDVCLQQKTEGVAAEDMLLFKEEMHTQIRSMSQTLNDFREFFKPSKEKLDFDVASMIRGVISMVSKEFTLDGINIKQTVEDAIHIVGHKNELSQVLLNIVSNARYAIKQDSKQSKEISISAKRQNGLVVIEVEDSGGGIDESLLPDKLFEHRFSTKGENGSGIGLWMSALIVKKHGGDIRAYNKNNGAVFEIVLPSK